MTITITTTIQSPSDIYNNGLYSISKSKSSPSSFMPCWMETDLTTPEIGDCTTISIFMALITAKGCPFSTVSPSLTLTLMTSPGMGEPTEPFTPFRALGWKCIS